MLEKYGFTFPWYLRAYQHRQLLHDPQLDPRGLEHVFVAMQKGLQRHARIVSDPASCSALRNFDLLIKYRDSQQNQRCKASTANAQPLGSSDQTRCIDLLELLLFDVERRPPNVEPVDP